MPAAARRRRTPFDVRRRTAIAAAAVLVLLLAGCTGHRDTGVHPQPQPDQSPPTATAGASGVPATRTIADTGGAPNLSALLNYPRVFAALAVVPENAAEISFTDVRSVKERLGFASLTSNSAHAEHVAFWRRAEADGSMFNGSALNAFERTMSRDFGWTGDDVDWEVDFATVETGCLRSMLCSTGRGRVFGLRPGLDWSVVTDSLARSGFTPDITPNGSLVNRTRLAPFQRVLPIAGLHAVATGNSRGLARIGAVLEGAPTFGRRLANFSRSLPTVESMHVSGGCVTLDSALPVPRRHRAPVPVPPDEVRRLAAAETVAVIVDKDGSARIEIETAAGARSSDVRARVALVRSWRTLQAGRPFSQGASVRGRVADTLETLTLGIKRMDVLVAMVRRGEAPWALCPYPVPA